MYIFMKCRTKDRAYAQCFINTKYRSIKRKDEVEEVLNCTLFIKCRTRDRVKSKII